MYVLAEGDFIYNSITNPELFFSHQKGLTAREKLHEQLFDRYAKGGSRFSSIRSSINFFVKKYAWLFSVRYTYFAKRTIDLILSSIFLIMLSPIFFMVALAIWIENPGAVIYTQTRVGRWGRLFKMYKFRSMKINAHEEREALIPLNESGAILFKIRNDPRLNKVGKIIRKLSIDELPQLWNVLRGDMSLVGPRPPLPDEVEKYKYSDRRRLDVTPGLTCTWQVSGRSEIGFKEQIQMDVAYIENQSLSEDIKLLLKTIPAVLLCKGAY
jgi:lipopolysaccharide/colanic/teichoic acid biosynthesis glycosyltransferase